MIRPKAENFACRPKPSCPRPVYTSTMVASTTLSRTAVRAGTLSTTLQASRRTYSSLRAVPQHGSASTSLSTPFRPTSSLLLHHTQRQEIALPILIGAGLVGAGLMANVLLKPKSGIDGPSSSKWVKGGFNSKMDKKEAAQVLGLRETALTRAKVKEAHRRMMIANHPDRGGAPYLASSKSFFPHVKQTPSLLRAEDADPCARQRSTKRKTCLTRWFPVKALYTFSP